MRIIVFEDSTILGINHKDVPMVIESTVPGNRYTGDQILWEYYHQHDWGSTGHFFSLADVFGTWDYGGRRTSFFKAFQPEYVWPAVDGRLRAL